jgi:phage terminase Nu1 subunit (DNA packaging protein)
MSKILSTKELAEFLGLEIYQVDYFVKLGAPVYKKNQSKTGRLFCSKDFVDWLIQKNQKDLTERGQSLDFAELRKKKIIEEIKKARIENEILTANLVRIEIFEKEFKEQLAKIKDEILKIPNLSKKLEGKAAPEIKFSLKAEIVKIFEKITK